MATFNFPQATDLENVVTGRGSFLLFAEQDGRFNDLQDDLDNFYTLKQSIINTSLQINSPQLNVATIPIGRAPFPGQAGPKDVQGSFNITAPLRFSELLWRNLINAKTVAIDQSDSPFTDGTVAQTGILTGGTLPSTAGGDVTITSLTQPSGGVPVRLILTKSSSADGDTMTVYGENYFDEKIRETLTFGDSGADLIRRTNRWFKSIDRITSSGVTGTLGIGSLSTAPTAGNDGGQWTNLRLTAGSEILNGLTIVQVIGGATGSVDTFFDCWLQSVNFRFAREEVVAEEWTVVGRDGLQTTGPDGVQDATAFVPQFTFDITNTRMLQNITDPPDNSPVNPAPDKTFRDADIRGVSGWQTAVSFRNEGSTTPISLAVIDGTATLNANTNFVPRVGSRPPGSAFQRTAESTVQLTMEFHKQYEPLVQAQLNNETFENVRLEMTALTETGFPAQRFITFKQLELTEAPVRNVDSDNYVSLSISGRVLPSTPSATDDIRVDLKVPGRNNTVYQAWAGVGAAGATPTNGRLRRYS